MSNVRYGITENCRVIPLYRKFDEDIAVDGSKCLLEDLPSLSIDGSKPFSIGDYIKFNIDDVTSESFVARVKYIKHQIYKSTAYNGKDFLYYGYIEIIDIHFENSLSSLFHGYDMYSMCANRLTNIEVVDEDAYKKYLDWENSLLQEHYLESVRRKVEKRNKEVRRDLNLLNPAQVNAVAKQIVRTYKDPTIEDYDREIENCANGLYGDCEGVNLAKVVWQKHLYPVLRDRAIMSGVDPQELVKQLTEYLKSYEYVKWMS